MVMEFRRNPAGNVGDVGRRRQEFERPRPTQALIIHQPDDTTIGTGATTLYTVPSDRFFMVEEITVTNVQGALQVFSLYFVPNGGSAGTDNAVIYNEQMQPATSYRLSTVSDLIMQPSAILQASTTTSGGVNVTFWGVEITGI